MCTFDMVYCKHDKCSFSMFILAYFSLQHYKLLVILLISLIFLPIELCNSSLNYNRYVIDYSVDIIVEYGSNER